MAERSEPLVGENAEAEQSFYKNEIKTMCGIGWPMLISFFCRFGMASEDSAFVGHIASTAKFLTTGHSVLSIGASLLGYGFLAAKGAAEGALGYGPMDYLAAAGLSDMVTNILIIPPLAFNQSLNALVSQAMGSGNRGNSWERPCFFFFMFRYSIS